MAPSTAANPRIMMMGCGAVGGVIAAGLLGAGYDVTLVTHNPSISDAISNNGLHLVTPAGRRTLPAAVCAGACPDLSGVEGWYDIALMSMKATGVEEATRDVLPLLSPNGYVVTLQNGIVEDRVAELAGRDRVIGAVVGWGATMHKPGIYEMTSRGETVIGELDGSVTDRVTDLQRILSAAAPTSVSANITGVLWSKLAINCAITTLGAITGQTLGTLLRRRPARRLALAIVSEVLDTAAAYGVALEPVGGTLDLGRLYLRPERRRGGLRPAQIPQHLVMRVVGLKFRKLRSSMLQSLERGREPQIAFLNGYIETRAREIGVPTPTNTALTLMVREIAAGARQISPGNLTDLLACI
jgi:2-dehydropantoate 2-reductase